MMKCIFPGHSIYLSIRVAKHHFMLYLNTLFGLILSVLYPDFLCRPWSQFVSSLCIGIWWEPVQIRYKNWWCSVIEEEQSYFLCVWYWAIQVTVPERLLTAMMSGKKMESAVKPVFPLHLWSSSIYLLCSCTFPHHQS